MPEGFEKLDIDSRISRRDALKLISLGAGAWILSSCTPAPSGATPEKAAPTATTAVQSHSATATADLESAPSTPTPETTTPIEITGMPTLPEGFEAGRLTPIEEFYVQSFNGVAKPDEFNWRLNITGLVDTPLSLSLTQLRLRPSVEVMRTLECIGNPVGGTLIGNATWKGASLKALLEEAGIQPQGQYVLFLSADEYETSITTELALDERSLVVYEMNDEPLTVAHGFPARLLLPGVYGQKQPKWVTSIRVSERDSIGTWETKGWSNTAEIQINSRIETPRLRQTIPAGEPYFITGIAMADTSGVQSVEVSVDDGATWQQAELAPGPNKGVWTLWNWEWANPVPGKYVVVARATDGNGIPQTASGTFGVLDNVFPNGSSLMHNLSVTVV